MSQPETETVEQSLTEAPRPPEPAVRAVEPPPKGDLLEHAWRIFNTVVAEDASDLHFVSNSPPIMRVDGRLVPMEFPSMTGGEIDRMMDGLLGKEKTDRFEHDMELDFSLSLTGIGRFRGNLHRQRGQTEAAFRVVTEKIRSIVELGLPMVIGELARRRQGLILVTGPTGSGKSTTLAGMLDQINDERECLIITIEDPIEYLHTGRRCIIKQRELGTDTRSFATALRHALRQDPDIIVVGEMRDLDTISTALTAAETGHLVLATIHTPDVIQTVDRIIDVFPPHQQNQVRLMFANTIQGIVAQQLFPIPGGRGRVAATEILIATPAVRQILRQGKNEQLVTIMQTAQDTGMMTMDKSLKQLYQRGRISYDDALSRSNNPEGFEHI